MARPVVYADTKLVDRLRRSNLWFEHDEESRGRGRKRESTKALYERCMKPRAGEFRRILEIGLCEGASSLWIWNNVRPDLWLGIDPWFPDRIRHSHLFQTWRENFWWNVEQKGAENLTVPPPGGRVTTEFRFGPTRCFAAEWPSQEFLRGPVNIDGKPVQFDLAIVDGDHHGAEALTDMVLCWPKLKRGGILVIDDYNRRWLHGRAHVREAAVAFCMAFEERIEKVLETPRQLWLRKRTEV